jgi:S-adenosylmethionine synthetase
LLKNVAAGVADEILVQVSYAIGLAKPMGIFIDTWNVKTKLDGEIAKRRLSLICVLTLLSND